MQKDVIYIDVEDDITAIIGKVKASTRHIVALVPPKRIGAIQSAVNLKLVHRAAEQADKRLVIISNNAALMALAGSAGIPVAKNLQSKPELAEIPALDIDDGDDVIDGDDIPASTHHSKKSNANDDAVVDEIVAEEEQDDADEPVVSKKPTRVAGATAVVKEKASIPNFDAFRKKLFIGLAALILVGGFLIWALLFAPRAAIVITARTTDVALNSSVTLGQALATDLKAGTIKAEVKTLKKDVSVPLTATGKKDVGEKATGTVKLYNDSFAAITVSGTVTAGGFNFILASPVTIPKGACTSPSNCSLGSATGTITAAASGANANGVTGDLGDLPNGVTGSLTAPTSGGTDKTVTVIQQSDVDQVSGSILKTGEADAAKADLKKQFSDDYIVLESTFTSDSSGVKPSPAIGTEVTDGKAALSGAVTFSVVGVAKAEASKYLDAYFVQRIDGRGDQKVYSNGASAVSFTNVTGKDGKYAANISTNGKVGPKIDENALKEFARGKHLGDIQSHIQAINGVDSVDVKFSPFWVSSAPDDTKRISVEFKVNGQ